MKGLTFGCSWSPSCCWCYCLYLASLLLLASLHLDSTVPALFGVSIVPASLLLLVLFLFLIHPWCCRHPCCYSLLNLMFSLLLHPCLCWCPFWILLSVVARVRLILEVLLLLLLSSRQFVGVLALSCAFVVDDVPTVAVVLADVVPCWGGGGCVHTTTQFWFLYMESSWNADCLNCRHSMGYIFFETWWQTVGK